MTSLRDLPDADVRDGLRRAVVSEARALIDVLRHLAEFDRRKLFLPEYTSMFVYVTVKLGYSEDEAWKRIGASKAAEKYPLIYQLLEQRHIHLTAVIRLAPHLTPENHRDLLWSAAGRTKLEIEAMVACLAPLAPKRDYIRTLTAAPAPEARLALVPASQRALIAAPATLEPPKHDVPAPQPSLVQFSFTGGGGLLKKIQRAQDLLRHKYPRARLGEIIDDALDALLDKKDPDRILARKMRQRRL